MSLTNVVLVLVAVVLVLWLINSYVPFNATAKRWLNIIVVVVLIVWLFAVAGLWEYLKKTF